MMRFNHAARAGAVGSILLLLALGGCRAPEPEVGCAEALSSCRSQRQAAVDRAEYLEGELAAAAVTINNLEGELQDLHAKREPPCVRVERFTDPPETWCTVAR